MEIKIKNNYSDLTIKDFVEITNISKSEIDDLDKVRYLLSILSNLTIKEIDALKLTDFNKLNEEASFLKKELDYKKEGKLSKSYKCGDYTLIPTLDLHKMTTGAYIDYCSILSNEEPLYSKIEKVLSVLLIPKGHKYNDGYNLDEVISSIYNNFKIVDAFVLSFFYQALTQVYVESLIRYSEKILKKEMKSSATMEKKEKIKEAIEKLTEFRTLIKNGGGLHQ